MFPSSFEYSMYLIREKKKGGGQMTGSLISIEAKLMAPQWWNICHFFPTLFMVFSSTL